MRRIITVSKMLTLLWGTVLAMSSCLKENTDDCFDELTTAVRIVVRTLAEETKAADSDVIDNVYLYIFDEEKLHVSTWQGAAYTYGERYEALLQLEPGTYHFVVWTNQGEIYTPTYSIPAETKATAEGLVVGLTRGGGEIENDIPDLHHGILNDAEVVINEDNEFTIIIRPNTYRLNYTVKGLTPTADDYRFTVRDNNSHYNFDNTIVEGMEEFDYVRTATFAGEEITASMKVLKLEDDRNPHFDFGDATLGVSLYEHNLVELIRTAYAGAGLTVDFETTFEFDIVLEFDLDFNVTVTVDGWNYNGNPTDL